MGLKYQNKSSVKFSIRLLRKPTCHGRDDFETTLEFYFRQCSGFLPGLTCRHASGTASFRVLGASRTVESTLIS